MMLAVLTLYIISDRMIKEYGAVGGMRTGRVNLRQNLSQSHFVHHRSHMT
jgi:hypothetical protein